MVKREGRVEECEEKNLQFCPSPNPCKVDQGGVDFDYKGHTVRNRLADCRMSAIFFSPLESSQSDDINLQYQATSTVKLIRSSDTDNMIDP